jgi:hypothetical protein
VIIETATLCDCQRLDLRHAQRLNTLCLCPQRPTAVGAHLQVAAVPVFVASADLEKMATLIRTIEEVVHGDRWQARVLAAAPAIARHDQRTAGVLFGYDFHLGDGDPQLIEINSNAGGALIVAEVLHGQSGCCASGSAQTPACQAQRAETAIIDSLLMDFELARGHRTPRLIAIVDRHPPGQYLYPEFQRVAALLRERGLRAEICDPSELTPTPTGLTLHGDVVDLIYNRLTDFYFEDSALAPLRAAYLNDHVVITPNPRHHALYADKRHLALLSDAQQLEALGVSAAQQQVLLQGIPMTRPVDTAHAEQLWRDRKTFFFKPAAAYGGKGAYRGAKLTRTTFERLLRQDYVAQCEIEPPLRRARVDGTTTELKVDVRCYVYRGEIQLTAARLWRGQTTNFRTPGGGFATVSATDS